MEPKQSESQNLKQHVLSRLEREKVCPRSRWQFVAKEYAVWGAWVFTVLVASAAVAVSLFVIMHRQYAVYEATHESFFDFMLEVLPYLWFVVFLVSAALAIYHIRHTKRGYRYSLWSVAGVGVLASLVGGMIFHYVGMSYVFDKSLGYYVSGYWSQDKIEKKFWQQPEEGRVLGYYIHDAVPSSTLVIVRDIKGRDWPTETRELFEDDIALLKTGKQVRILGEVLTEEGRPHFYACGVFPWMYDRMMTLKELQDTRELAIERLHQHRDRFLARAKEQYLAMTPEHEASDTMAMARAKTSEMADENSTMAFSATMAEEPATRTMSVSLPPEHCGEIEAVKRLRE